MDLTEGGKEEFNRINEAYAREQAEAFARKKAEAKAEYYEIFKMWWASTDHKEKEARLAAGVPSEEITQVIREFTKKIDRAIQFSVLSSEDLREVEQRAIDGLKPLEEREADLASK